MPKIKTTDQRILLNLLDPDPRNANVCDEITFNKLCENMGRSGFSPSLTVRISPEDPHRYMIIDGHHRFKAAQKLEWTDIPCQVLEASEVDINLLLVTLNRLRGEDNPQKRARLIESLCTTFDLVELTTLIPETQNEVNDLLALLATDHASLEKEFKKALDEEAQTLPVILNYLVSKSDAKTIQRAINHYLPEGVTDPGIGLTLLCESALSHLIAPNE